MYYISEFSMQSYNKNSDNGKHSALKKLKVCKIRGLRHQKAFQRGYFYTSAMEFD